MPFHADILAPRPHGALSIGATRGLARRIEQLRAWVADTHTRRYGIHRLVWFEPYATAREASDRERRLKRWRRAWKDALIEEANPAWSDLTPHLVQL